MHLRRFIPVIAIAAAALSVAACTNSRSDSGGGSAPSAPSAAPAAPAAAKTSFKIIYVPKLVHPWTKDEQTGIAGAAEELKKGGITVDYSWNAPPQADISVQTKLITEAIATKPDALLVSCLDPSANTPLLQQAADQGILVTTFDNDCPDAPRLFFVGHADSTIDGRLMADALAEATGGSGEVGVLVGSPTALQHRDRVRGFTDQIAAKYPGLKVVTQQADNDDQAKANSLATSMIASNPNLKGIYSVTATGPVGAAQAVVAAGKKGQIAVVGQDLLPDMVTQMRSGDVQASVAQHVYDIGYWSAMYTIKALQGHVVPSAVETGASLVKASDLDRLASCIGDSGILPCPALPPAQNQPAGSGPNAG